MLEASEDEVAASPEDNSGVSSEDQAERGVSLNAPLNWPLGSLPSPKSSTALAESSERVFWSWTICWFVGLERFFALHSSSTSASIAASSDVSNGGQ